MLVTAHISHWYGELLYVGPVLVVVVWLSVANLREKRRLRREFARREPFTSTERLRDGA